MDKMFFIDENIVEIGDFKRILDGNNNKFKIVLISSQLTDIFYILKEREFIEISYQEGLLRKLFKYVDKGLILKSFWHSTVDDLTKNSNGRYSKNEFLDKISKLEELEIFLYQMEWN